MRLYDPLEMELPDLGLLVMQDAETGEQLFVDTHDRGFRKRFAARRRSSARTSCATAFRDAGVDALELSTDDDLVDAILRFADLRKRRSQLAAGAAAGLPQGGASGGAAMTFLWPEFLWLLLLVPLLVAAVRLCCCGARRSWRCATPAWRWCGGDGRGAALAAPRAAAPVPARARR